MEIKTFISEWLRLSNAFDTEQYLEKYSDDAVLDDPSVGRKFIGKEGIRDYFVSYFIGYETQTRLLRLEVDGDEAHLEVEFTGIFPGGKLGGTFDMTFRSGKIATVTADLIS